MSTPFRDCRDTFLHFLYDNLAGIAVVAIREDPNDPSASVLKPNAINVQFLKLSADTVATQQVSIDIIHDTENTAVDWMESVWTLLRSAFYTPLYNYSTPSAPVAKHTNIMWDRDSVKFIPVMSENFVRYKCVLPLKFYAII